MRSTSGGKWSNVLTPTTWGPAPTANTISVTAGTSEMIRAGRAFCGAGRFIAAVVETSSNRPAIAATRIESVLRILPPPYQQPEKERPANQRRDDPDRQLHRSQHGPRDDVARDQEGGAE